MNFANFVDLAAENAGVKPAVGDPTELLTYATLREETAAAANVLAELGVTPDDRVAVCLQNSVTFPTVHFGIMKLGAVPVPVNTHFNAPKVRYILDTSSVSVLVTDESFAELAENVETLVTVDGSGGHDLRDMLDDAPTEVSIEPRRSDELAEVVYTSGTTGRPKGVHHTHGNLQANALGIVKYLNITHADIGLTVCQCFHVTGLNVTTTPLLVAEAENRLLPDWEPEVVLKTIETYGVTRTFVTPSMLIDLVDYEAVDRYDLTSLVTVGVGGAPMPSKRFDEVERTLGCPVLEGYGMTETTPLAAFNRLDSQRKRGSVGPPAREAVALRIEDSNGEEVVQPDNRGELLWRGDTVTPSYERSENNREAFVEHNGERWLRSGDIGYLDDDGYLFIVDRREDMFTTGCATVYPREIEDILYDLDGIAEVAVIDTRDDLRGAVVTAIIRRTDETLTADYIRAVSEERLEDHEVPQRIEFIEEIPRTATGKVDRVTLRETFGAAPVT